MNHEEIYTGVGVVDPAEIDRINIYQASIKAMIDAVDNLPVKPDHLLVDGLKLPHPHISGEKIIKGDTLSLSIAAASIVAKVTRDRLMVADYHQKYPQYGFDRHKGYSTQMHMEALDRYGPCPIHRRSYEPVRNACQQQFLF
jgi:ribonuclease HII